MSCFTFKSYLTQHLFSRSQQWRELTHQTINKLGDASALTVQRLEASQELQQDIAAGQKITVQRLEASQELQQDIAAGQKISLEYQR